ncbi:hypothetical protein RQP46_010767 [Phenoliferia psychrophenolica]
MDLFTTPTSDWLYARLAGISLGLPPLSSTTAPYPVLSAAEQYAQYEQRYAAEEAAKALVQSVVTSASHIPHIPRPPNSFFLFRSHAAAEMKTNKDGHKQQKNISVVAGEIWRGLGDEEKKVWDRLAEQEKRDHREKYPAYKFNPKRKAGSVKSVSSSSAGDDDSDSSAPKAKPKPKRVRSPRKPAATAATTSDISEDGDFVAQGKSYLANTSFHDNITFDFSPLLAPMSFTSPTQPWPATPLENPRPAGRTGSHSPSTSQSRSQSPLSWLLEHFDLPQSPSVDVSSSQIHPPTSFNISPLLGIGSSNRKPSLGRWELQKLGHRRVSSREMRAQVDELEAGEGGELGTFSNLEFQLDNLEAVDEGFHHGEMDLFAAPQSVRSVLGHGGGGAGAEETDSDEASTVSDFYSGIFSQVNGVY